jgi:hypothetical protein
MHDDADIRTLPLSRRLLNSLLSGGVRSYGQLRRMTREELLRVRNVGPVMLAELARLLHLLGEDSQIESLRGTPSTGLPGPVTGGALSRSVSDLLGEHGVEVRDQGIDRLRTSLENAATASTARRSSLYARLLLSALNTPTMVATSEWRMDEGSIAVHLTNELGMFLRYQAGDPVSLVDELVPLVHHLARGRARDTLFAIRHLGLDGQRPDTLATLAAEAVPRLTRERVRQIVAAFEVRARRIRPPLPIFETILHAMSAHGKPLSLEELFVLTPEDLRPPTPPHFAVIRTLEKWGWLPASSWLELQSVRFVAAGPSRDNELRDYAKYFTGLVRTLNRRLRLSGAVRLAAIAGNSPVTAESLKIIARSSPYLEVRSDGWVLLLDCQGTLIARRARRVLDTLGGLPIDMLRGGLVRCAVPGRHRERLSVPPVSVLTEVLRRSGFDLATADSVVSLEAGRRRDDELPTFEAAMLAFLRTDPPVKTRREVVEAVGRAGASSATAVYYLGSSPFVGRVAPSLYTLLGRRVSPFDCQSASARHERQNASSLRDVRFEIDGTIRLTYAVDLALGIGPFFLRASTVPEGRWRLLRAEAAPSSLVVRQSYVTGLNEEVRALASHGARLVEVRFDSARREVRVDPVVEPIG